MIGRIGTFSNAQSLITASLQVQSQLSQEQQQVASSQKSTTFSGLGSDAGTLLDVSGQSARLKAESTAATNAGTLVQTAYATVGNISDLATNIRTQLAAAMNGTNGSSGNSPITASAANAWLSDLQTDLNTQVGGQYVFSGQAADREPVDFTSSTYDPTTAPSTADTAYYNGASAQRTLTTVDGSKIPISTTADQPGFENLARALKLLAANPTDPTTLQNAYSLVTNAETELNQSQATLSQQATTLNTLSSNDTAKTTTLDNFAITLNGADLTTATVLVTQYSTQLQALYSTIGQLSQVSILKYISG